MSACITTVSSQKAESVTEILSRASFDLKPGELFLCRIDHKDRMSTFLSEQAVLFNSRFSTPEADLLRKSCAMAAGTDFGHIAPDWQYVLDRGIPGILEDLKAEKERHRDDASLLPYYEDRILVYGAFSASLNRAADYACSLNTAEGDFVSGNLRHLAVSAPETLAQAMQLILIFYVYQTSLDKVIVRSLGGLDRMLAPYYRKDLEGSTFTQSRLAEITDSFFLQISGMKVTANLPFYICGTDGEGKDASNEFTLFLLNRYRALDIYDPKLHVLYHEHMNKEVLRLILEMIREGKNSFVFINTAAASKALENVGISKEDAKKVIVYGCYETAAEGKEVPCTCAGMINMAKAVEFALYNGKEAGGTKTVSVPTGEDFETFDDFYKAVLTQLSYTTEMCMDTISLYEPHYHTLNPSLFLSPTFRESRESGIDVYSGGAKYNNTSVVGAGLATLVDSLTVIRHLVFEEKKLTLSELAQILQNDWKDQETLRLTVRKRYPKFGNNTEESDRLTVQIHTHFADLINNRPNGRGGVFRCGSFSVDWRFWMGEKTAATPDGRFAKDPLSKNLCAVPGQDRSGVTAYLNTILKLDSSKTPDGYVADVALHCSAVAQEDGLQAFSGLLSTFMKRGGFAVHFNILSPETLLAAQKDPDKYRNLQIRLCGWNVRFVDLDTDRQNEFINQASNVL